jgi:hypothetical protein
MSEPVFVTLLVIKVFEQLGIPYVIGGSFASTVYGRVRTTLDVDIVASMKSNHIDVFVQALASAFYIDEVMIRSAIAHRTSFNLIHLETMFKVDIFLPKGRPFEQQQIARRVKRVIDEESGREVYFATPEDTILSKLEWYRLGGEQSEVQWRDVQAILRQRLAQLDIEYLRNSAQEMGLKDLLKRSLEESQS